MIIRNAKPSDALQLQPLIHQLGYKLTIEEIQERITSCLKIGIYYYWVLEVNKLIVGLCIFVIYPKFYKTSNNCFLEVLVVLEQYRKQGIASKLLIEFENFAKTKHCSSISLLTNLGREKEIHNFYRNRGYHNEGIRSQLYLRKEL